MTACKQEISTKIGNHKGKRKRMSWDNSQSNPHRTSCPENSGSTESFFLPIIWRRISNHRWLNFSWLPPSEVETWTSISFFLNIYWIHITNLSITSSLHSFDAGSCWPIYGPTGAQKSRSLHLSTSSHTASSICNVTLKRNHNFIIAAVNSIS